FTEQIKDHGMVERQPLLEGKSMHVTVASTHKPKAPEMPAAGQPRQARPSDGGEAEPAAVASAAESTKVPAAGPTQTKATEPATVQAKKESTAQPSQRKAEANRPNGAEPEPVPAGRPTSARGSTDRTRNQTPPPAAATGE